MFKILVIALCIQFCISQMPPFNEPCRTDAWPPKPERTIPTYSVNLDLDPQQRWADIASQYKIQIQNLIAYFKQFLLEFSPNFQKIINLIDNNMGNLTKTFPKPYGDEIIGIAAATNLPVGDIVLYNTFYELFTLCTSIVSQDSNGNILHARNLDFGLFMGWDKPNDTWTLTEYLRTVVINVNFTRGGNTAYTTTTFAGFIGALTGVKPNAFSVTINDRFDLNGGYIGFIEWVYNIDRNQSWVTFLSRDLLNSETSTFDDAIETLSSVEIMAPVYYIVGGILPLQGAVITRERAKAIDVWRLGTNNTWFLVETNYDHWNKPLFLDDRVTPATNCMNSMGQLNSSFAGLFNVLSTKPVLNKLTVYTALIDVKTGHLESYIQKCEDPCWFV